MASCAGYKCGACDNGRHRGTDREIGRSSHSISYTIDYTHRHRRISLLHKRSLNLSRELRNRFRNTRYQLRNMFAADEEPGSCTCASLCWRSFLFFSSASSSGWRSMLDLVIVCNSCRAITALCLS